MHSFSSDVSEMPGSPVSNVAGCDKFAQICAAGIITDHRYAYRSSRHRCRGGHILTVAALRGPMRRIPGCSHSAAALTREHGAAYAIVAVLLDEPRSAIRSDILTIVLMNRILRERPVAGSSTPEHQAPPPEIVLYSRQCRTGFEVIWILSRPQAIDPPTRHENAASASRPLVPREVVQLGLRDTTFLNRTALVGRPASRSAKVSPQKRDGRGLPLASQRVLAR
jgi:hypothetical protein